MSKSFDSLSKLPLCVFEGVTFCNRCKSADAFWKGRAAGDLVFATVADLDTAADSHFATVANSAVAADSLFATVANPSDVLRRWFSTVFDTMLPFAHESLPFAIHILQPLQISMPIHILQPLQIHKRFYREHLFVKRPTCFPSRWPFHCGLRVCVKSGNYLKVVSFSSTRWSGLLFWLLLDSSRLGMLCKRMRGGLCPRSGRWR